MPLHPGKSHQRPGKKHSALLSFLRTLPEHLPADLDLAASGLHAASWKGVDCISCANCCRHMSPRYTVEDLKRIAHHFRMSVRALKNKWLYESGGSWMNRSQPCPFLHTATNQCTIYAIRPADCAGFPHLLARPLTEYLPTHAQNVAFCPATERFIGALREKVEGSVNAPGT